MIRQERRKKLRDATKELKQIKKNKLYLQFKNTSEFMLPKEEIDKLIAGTHESKRLQERFKLASAIYTRLDYLRQTIAELSLPKQKDVSIVD
jgi:hypothetical protein